MSRERTSSFFGDESIRNKLGGGGGGGAGYDGEFKQELQGEGANGVRGWYDNFHTIDWIHDAIKHSIRLRRLRRLKRSQGVRGTVKNLWDGAQGWVLVTLIGVVTACIAYAVIGAEMFLYDLKEGYCGANWKLAKRFCCQSDGSSSDPIGGFMLQGWSAASMRKGGGGGDECEAWTTWAKVWEDWTGQGVGAGTTFEYCFYVFLAVSSRYSSTTANRTRQPS
jgi:chloride channel 3/4/5